jgi:hypothetical protein
MDSLESLDSLEETAEALAVLCTALFGKHHFCFTNSFVKRWAACFPLEVILYALLEAELKQKRTPDITTEQLVKFAETIMLRKSRTA